MRSHSYIRVTLSPSLGLSSPLCRSLFWEATPALRARPQALCSSSGTDTRPGMSPAKMSLSPFSGLSAFAIIRNRSSFQLQADPPTVLCIFLTTTRALYKSLGSTQLLGPVNQFKKMSAHCRSTFPYRCDKQRQLTEATGRRRVYPGSQF